MNSQTKGGAPERAQTNVGRKASSPRPTMKEVAALSGTSLKTVSRVLNEETGVSPELIERVRNAAKTLKYRHDLTASSLRRNDRKTNTIGLLLEDVSNPYSSALQRAIEDVALQHSVAVIAGSVNEDDEREYNLAMALIARRVDGLIVVPTSQDQSYLAPEIEQGTPVVFVDRKPKFLNVDSVVSANREGAHQATDHLIKHGHRDIAFLGDLQTIGTAEDRFLGYKEAMAAHNLPLNPAYIELDLNATKQAEISTRRLMELDSPPSAIFASQNLITIGVVRALRTLNLHREIAVIGFDDIPYVDLIEPGLTLVAQNVSGIGTAAAETLFMRIKGDATPSRNRVMAVTLIERGSGEIPGPFFN